MSGGWRVGSFLPIELDVALTLTTGYFAVASGDEEFGGLLSPLAADWRAEGAELIGGEPRTVSLIELLTELTGTTFEADYARALLPVRSLDPAGAIAALSGGEPPRLNRSEPPGLAGEAPAVGREQAVERLAELLVDRHAAAYEAAGLELDEEGHHVALLRREAELLGRVLAGGDLADRFWHWLDRFYYSWYEPWRRGRGALLKESEQRALLALGAVASEEHPPRLDWLPPQNVIQTIPEMRRRIEGGEIGVMFWVEPFGFADLVVIREGAICVSFGEPGRIYTEFRRHAGEVARRAKALGDPTRLLILRLIRHFPMMNTELADYLGIARPTASIHAKILREAGLIRSRQDGHAVRHEIDRGEIRRLFDDLARFLDLDSF